MKILMIAPQPFLMPRGTPISVYQRLMGLSALGYSIDLLTYHLGESRVIPGVRIFRIPNISLIKSIKPGPSFRKVILDILLWIKSIQLLAFNKYDVIHSHEEAAYFANVLSKVFQVPHLYDMHSSLSQQLRTFQGGRYTLLVSLFDALENWVIRSCAAVITIGADLEERVQTINASVKTIKIENLPIQAVVNIPLPTTSKNLTAELNPDHRRVILYTGTFEHYQGLDLLFASFARVVRERPHNLLLLVGGQPSQIDYWKNIASDLDILASICFTGSVSMERIVDYLEMADLLVSPRLKGMSVPLKLYTYLFSGKPIIATRTQAHIQVLSDEIAMLVQPTAEEFAQGIIRLLDDPEYGRQLGDKARSAAEEHYNFQDYTKKLGWIYQTLSTHDQAPETIRAPE